eukprot:gene3711-4276_t
MYFYIPASKRGSANDIEGILEIQMIEQLKSYKTGAVLLIQNETDPTSIIVRSGIHGRFTHVAIYLDSQFYTSPNPLAGRPMLWQASGEKTSSMENVNEGPDLHIMSRFIAYYLTQYPKSRFVLRGLNHALTEPNLTSLRDYITQTVSDRKVEFCSNFQLFWTHHTSKLKILQLLDPYVLPEGRQHLTFCSKLVGDTFHTLGKLPPKMDSFDIHPNHFAVPNFTDIFSTKETEMVFMYT